MNKTLKIIFLVTILGLLVTVLIYFSKKNSKSANEFETQKPFYTTIVKKSVATGKVIPEDEVNIKPQISGIIDRIYKNEGDYVKAGDLIAKIKVIPNEQTLNNAKGRVRSAKINFDNNTIEYKRNKTLLDRGVISNQDFNTVEVKYKQSEQELKNAKSDLQIIQVGSTNGSLSANTNIRATVSGTILEIPIKEGDQVIQSNNFNDGTTIASIADLNKMIFEGKVDEAEISKLKEGTILDVKIAAIENVKYKAKLNFVAPKGTEEQGAVLFKIKAALELDDQHYIRAGFSANAELILDKKENILAIKEALVQYDRETEEPYIEIEKKDQVFDRKNVKLGLSDGINIEILSEVEESDDIKVWNKASKDKKGKRK